MKLHGGPQRYVQFLMQQLLEILNSGNSISREETVSISDGDDKLLHSHKKTHLILVSHLHVTPDLSSQFKGH